MSQQIDENILTILIREASSMQKIAEQKGTTSFPESAKSGMLRIQMYALITTLQLYKVLPQDLHIKDGALVRDPSESLDDND